MRIVKNFRRPTSIIVMVAFTFLICFWANQSPAAARAPASEKGPAASLEKGGNGGTGFIEQEGSEPVVKKHKKFPWLVVGVAVVIGAAALYFLVLKKSKYTLTVSLAGATGTPAATAKYTKGTVVSYNYSPQSGFVNLEVKLDGAAVASAGTLTMDADHSLAVTAVQGSTIQVNSNPSGAKIYIDNSDTGSATPHGFMFPAAVTKKVLVRMCGYKDYTQPVSTVSGQTVTVNANLVRGILEDFDTPVSCWNSGNGGAWSTSGGVYKCAGFLSGWGYSFYNIAFSDNFTATVKMRRPQGDTLSNSLYLAESSSATSSSGYAFQFGSKDQYWKNGHCDIVMNTNWNLITGKGKGTAIMNWTSNSAINKNQQDWNELKVVKSGSNYSYYINGAHMYSFTDATYNPRYLALLFYTGDPYVRMEYDYVYLSVGAGADSIPGLLAAPFASVDENHPCSPGMKADRHRPQNPRMVRMP